MTNYFYYTLFSGHFAHIHYIHKHTHIYKHNQRSDTITLYYFFLFLLPAASHALSLIVWHVYSTSLARLLSAGSTAHNALISLLLFCRLLWVNVYCWIHFGKLIFIFFVFIRIFPNRFGDGHCIRRNVCACKDYCCFVLPAVRIHCQFHTWSRHTVTKQTVWGHVWCVRAIFIKWKIKKI